jgi:DNA-binding MarR family transcriptional regulator
MLNMTRSLIAEQAKTVAALLPMLMRRLFAGEDDPAEGLPLAQLRVCSVLLGGQQPMSAISRELGVSLSATTQIADRLERAGLVERVAKGGDRRVRCLRLTRRGAKMMRSRQQMRITRIRTVLDGLPAKARRECVGTLEALVRACTAAERNGQARRAKR